MVKYYFRDFFDLIGTDIANSIFVYDNADQRVDRLQFFSSTIDKYDNVESYYNKYNDVIIIVRQEDMSIVFADDGNGCVTIDKYFKNIKAFDVIRNHALRCKSKEKSPEEIMISFGFHLSPKCILKTNEYKHTHGDTYSIWVGYEDFSYNHWLRVHNISMEIMLGDNKKETSKIVFSYFEDAQKKLKYMKDHYNSMNFILCKN